LNAREKTLGAGEKHEDFETYFEFQNPQVFHQHLRFSPEHSTLVDSPILQNIIFLGFMGSVIGFELG
jgi:hypothetical protein